MNSEIERLQEALDAAPDHWGTRRRLAECHYHEGNLEEAARLVAEAPALPADAEEMIFAARLAATADPAKAHEILDTLLGDNPDCADAHETKAEIYEANDDPESAAKHRETAASLGADTGGGVFVVKEDDVEGEGEPVIPPEATPEEGPPSPAIPKPLRPRSEPAPDADAAAPDAVADFTPGPEEEKEDGSPAKDSSPVETAAPPPALSAAERPAADELEGHLNARELAALEAEEEEIVRRTQKKNKVASFVVALAVHAAIFLILIVIIVGVPRLNPPEIVAIAAPPTDAPPDLDKKKVRPNYSSLTKPSSKVVQVLTATAYSSVAVPAIDTPPPEILVPGLSMEDGIGMGISFQGAGDGWVSSLPAAIQSRCSLVERMSRLKVGGGSKKCEEAVRRALVWLSENQHDDGSWGRSFPVAMTGLALLAYLGHCETPDSPEFAENVIGAATYLMEIGMRNNGKVSSPGRNRSAYEHGIATYALCELYTLSRRGKRKIPNLSGLLREALPHIINGQNPNGSWLYNYAKGRSDTSVSGWQVQALKAALNTEIDFPGLEQAFEKSMEYLVFIQDQKNGGFGYSEDRREGRPSLTGVGVLGLQFGGRGDTDEVKKGLEFIIDRHRSMSYSNINFYDWYYSTQACFQEGGRTWDKWNGNFLDPLLDAQEKDGHWPAERSDTTDRQSEGDGTVYRTCLATLMLEVYYRYLPTGEKIKK